MPFSPKRSVMNEGETLTLVREKTTWICFNLSSRFFEALFTKGFTIANKKDAVEFELESKKHFCL